MKPLALLAGTLSLTKFEFTQLAYVATFSYWQYCKAPKLMFDDMLSLGKFNMALEKLNQLPKEHFSLALSEASTVTTAASLVGNSATVLFKKIPENYRVGPWKYFYQVDGSQLPLEDQNQFTTVTARGPG